MKGRSQTRDGQALGVLSGVLRLLRWSAGLLATVLACVLLAAAVLAWRLSAGPVDVTFLVQGFAHKVRPLSLDIGNAALSWDGWRRPDAPVTLSLTGLKVRNAAGDLLDRLDAASVSVSPASLLRLRLLPTALTADGGMLRLSRRADGEFEAAPGLPMTAGQHPGQRQAPFSELEHIRVSGVTVEMADQRSGITLSASDLSADFSRRDLAASMTGAGHAMIKEGRGVVREDTFSNPIRVTATMTPDDTGSRLDIGLGPVDPSTFATLLPASGAWHAPVSLNASIALDHALRPSALIADLTSGAGTLSAVGSDVPFAAAHVHLKAHPPDNADVDATLDLADPNGGPGPIVSVQASLTGNVASGGHLAGTLEVSATPVPISRLALWWPAPIAHDARVWVLTNLPRGTASNLAVHARLASRDGADGLSLASVNGGLDVSGAELHWLRPIPPITGASAHLRFVDEDTLAIALSSGHQGSLDVSGTRMRITGLSASKQPGDINARIRGPLAALLSVLNEKRLHLLSRQPLTLNNPSGTVDARLHVALPLDDRVTMDQIVIGAHVALARVHLGDIALGHSIDDGRFLLDADTGGLTMRGHAVFAALPVALSIGLDFRAGPPSEVTEHVHAETTADGAAIRRASTDFGRVLGGLVSLSADYNLQRDKHASLALDADLANATVATPFGWGKPAGPPATLHADLDLEHGRLAAIDQLRASGPSLDIVTHGLGGPNGLAGLALDRIEIGRTRASGRLEFPDATGGAFRLAASGPELDLASLFGRSAASPSAPGPKPAPAAPKPAPARTGQPWQADLAFTRVTLAHHVDIGGVHAVLDGGGARLRTAKATAAGPVPASGSLLETRAGRSLELRTDDAGDLLSAFDLTDRVRQGSLRVSATLAGSGLDDGMTGTARLDKFTLLRVPAVVRLLRDLTVYGLADPARTPDISVRKVTVPFEWADGILTLDHATAWQPAVGMTARGQIDTRSNTLDLTGTIVPAYIFNTLPGRLPLVGHLFSPERGGGLFAATFTLKGPAGSPAVKVNPLAALLPGVLRHLLPH